MTTRIILCSTHILKLVIKRVKAVKIGSELTKSKNQAKKMKLNKSDNEDADKLRKAFIIGLGVLQNAKSLKEFEETFRNIITIFNGKVKCRIKINRIKRINFKIARTFQIDVFI
jgi:hypothetical protein